MMKHSKYLSLAAIFALLTIGFTSCQKDQPIPEIDQEEIEGTHVLFTNTVHPEDVLLIKFDRTGKPEKSHYHLTKNETYKVEITLYNNGEINNQEFIDDIQEHQFFFLAPKEAVMAYKYQDDQLGLKGEMTFGEHDTAFDLTILLRHGLNKSHPAVQDWNSLSYQEAGGVDDLRVQVSLHLVSQEHTHD